MMTLNTLNALRTLTTDPAMIAELDAEIARAEKAQAVKAEHAEAKAVAYAEAKGVVVDALRDIGAPVSAAELYEEVADALPEGFTKGKMVYGMTRLWVDVIAKEGSTYSLR